MSNGPVSISSKVIDLKNNPRLNVKFTRKDWCSYKGVCMVNRLVDNENDICLKCKYRIALDVPKILEDANNGYIEFRRST